MPPQSTTLYKRQSRSAKSTPREFISPGWSNGAAMAVLYALNRPEIKAVAIYSAPDPFGAFDDPCPQIPVSHPTTNWKEIEEPNSHLAIMHVHDSCDIAGICPNGERLAQQMGQLGGHDARCNDYLARG
jgi:pimeloyl-ACP methyl ester carboxylesterase